MAAGGRQRRSIMFNALRAGLIGKTAADVLRHRIDRANHNLGLLCDAIGQAPSLLEHFHFAVDIYLHHNYYYYTGPFRSAHLARLNLDHSLKPIARFKPALQHHK